MLTNGDVPVQHGYFDRACGADLESETLLDFKNWVVDPRRERLSDMKPSEVYDGGGNARLHAVIDGEDYTRCDPSPITPFGAPWIRKMVHSSPATTSNVFRPGERLCYERMLERCSATDRKASFQRGAEHIDWLDELKAQLGAAEEIRVKHMRGLRRFSAESPVLAKLTGPMLEEIELALRPTPAHEALVKGFGLTINRSDMGTLADNQWLNDEVVNFYMSLLVERTKQNGNLPKLYAFNTFFFTKLATGGHAAVRRWTRKVDLFAYDVILVPLHSSMHWCLATVDFRKKLIAYYDSLGSNNERDNCLQTLQLYLEAESQDKRGCGLDWEPWKLEVISGLPQQHNGTDCGMFMCQYAECLSRDAKICFGQQHMPYFRKRVVYEILHGQLLPA